MSPSVTTTCSVEEALQSVIATLQMKQVYGTLPAMLEVADVLSLVGKLCTSTGLKVDDLPSSTLRALGRDAMERNKVHKQGEVDGFVSSSLFKSLERARMELIRIAIAA